MEPARPRVVLITGLSGSGKSTVANAFEDLGFYTVDNLPLPLLRQFLSDPLAQIPEHRRIAVVTDARVPGFHAEIPRILDEVDRDRLDLVLLFLEAADETLVRRFSETRRPHPLAADRPVIEGIRREREILVEVRGLADRIFDTSETSIHTIRSEIYRGFSSRSPADPGMVISLTSFGFKHGIPYGSDFVFDVRFVANPHFVDGLREKTGRDAPVQEFLDARSEFGEVVSRLSELVLYLLPLFHHQDRSYVSISIGCTGGRHRSVAVCERLQGALNEAGWVVQVIHRDLQR